MKPVFIIAEAGVNHNGNFNTAIKMIDAAKAFNADAIKFQSYIAEELVLPNTEKADYQKLGSDPGSQREMLKRYQLDFPEQTKLFDYAKKIGIEFISSPFDLKSLNFLRLINVNIIKIPSGEITNIQLLTKIAELLLKFSSEQICFISKLDLIFFSIIKSLNTFFKSIEKIFLLS